MVGFLNSLPYIRDLWHFSSLGSPVQTFGFVFVPRNMHHISDCNAGKPEQGLKNNAESAASVNHPRKQMYIYIYTELENAALWLC